jgi:hypothetical protein
MNRTMPLVLGCLALALCFAACKKEENTAHFDALLRKWCRSLRDLHYNNYRSCEAHPKAYAVFKEMYRDYYFEDIMLVDIEDADDSRTMKDPDGDSFVYRNADFECAEISRKTGRPTHVVRGNVMFVKYGSGPRSGEGWLMSNRTLVRIKR